MAEQTLSCPLHTIFIASLSSRTMPTQTSRLLRYVARGAHTLAENLERRHVINHMRGTGISVSRSFGTLQNDGFLASDNNGFLRHSEPLPALAFAYDYDDDEAENGNMNPSELNSSSNDDRLAPYPVDNVVTSRGGDFFLAAAAGGPPSGRGHFAPTLSSKPSSMVSGKGSHVGGGGNGRHRCPKCGTTVTFRCDYEENTFYCASCSGWFVVSPSTIMAGELDKMEDGSPYEEFMGKSRSARMADPEILMRHVSINNYAVDPQQL